MTIGTSLFLIAVGAILRYAVTATVAGVDIQTAGLILMVIGVVGLLLELALVALAFLRKIAIEERFLIEQFGAAYDRYRAEVPALLPMPERPR